MIRTLRLLALALLALAIVAVPATAKKSSGFKTGTYKATGDVSFKFKVYKGTCYADGGKKKTGYCLSGIGSPPKLQMDCPDVKDGVKDHEAFAFLPNQKHIPSSGKIRIKFTNPVRTDEFDVHTFNLDLGKKSKGSGSLSMDQQVKSIAVISTCTSGKKKFTVKK
ncbi:MAG: hypothetical protein JHC98_06205 [Thermoleophilaceae bacterium]|nr:hypothetical protein [Thermoleophilaceae bacterium]